MRQRYPWSIAERCVRICRALLHEVFTALLDLVEYEF